MMLQLIDDANKALNAECYYSALTLALAFPDICGKAEYPQGNSTENDIKTGMMSISVNMNSVLANNAATRQCLI